MRRYGKGWHRDSYRHYLAAKGIASRYDYQQKWMDSLGTRQVTPEVRSLAASERLKDLSVQEKYPSVYISESFPDLPVQGLSSEERIKQLEEQIAASEAEEASLKEDLTMLGKQHPFKYVQAAIKAREEAKLQKEIALLQSEYDSLRQNPQSGDVLPMSGKEREDNPG